MKMQVVMDLTDELNAYGKARLAELDALRKYGAKQPEHLADYAARQRELEAIAATLHVLAALVTCVGEMYDHPRAEITQRALHRLDLHRVKMASKAFTDAEATCNKKGASLCDSSFDGIGAGGISLCGSSPTSSAARCRVDGVT
jgi:hypothetical protein